MIHCFSIKGRHLVFDANSQALHRVDDLTLALLEGQSPAELAGLYPREEIDEALDEIAALTRQGLLNAPDPYGAYTPPEPCVKALCLNVAHACNLACGYCFAGQGSYGGGAGLMKAETARRAVDFLLAGCGRRRRLEVDFFGGEPLLNPDVIRGTVAYARERGAAAGKVFSFTVTTNAVLLDEDFTEFCLANAINVVLSLDGRPEVHDRLRRTRGGDGSYDLVFPRIRRFLERWAAWDGPKGYAFVRGTYTRNNLDFAADFEHLAASGIRHVSLEPVVSDPAEAYAVREGDVERIREEYRRLAEVYLDLARRGDGVRFFHFELDLEGGPCLPKRLTGCGAGTDYLAVAADGGLYPCHQFVGQEGFLVGDVTGGIRRRDLVELFRQAHVYRKKACRSCWAKFLCSGGCHAAAYFANRNLLEPSAVACELMRARLECALYIKAREFDCAR
ncbi:MAG: thioether cross-link-forming SCIFF peptide maturase [Bacillota bacterium]|nr:thioether cross-link-forming SCIFF peptide maturase [Bacillota bacterium]